MLLNLQKVRGIGVAARGRYTEDFGANTEMATIWFVKDGEVQNGPAMATKPLDWCVSTLGLCPDDWVTDLATKKLTIGENANPELAPDRGFCFVLVQVGDEDLTGSGGWKTGFHLLDIHATTARNELER
jgi:hypothetical protein